MSTRKRACWRVKLRPWTAPWLNRYGTNRMRAGLAVLRPELQLIEIPSPARRRATLRCLPWILLIAAFGSGAGSQPHQLPWRQAVLVLPLQIAGELPASEQNLGLAVQAVLDRMLDSYTDLELTYATSNYKTLFADRAGFEAWLRKKRPTVLSAERLGIRFKLSGRVVAHKRSSLVAALTLVDHQSGRVQRTKAAIDLPRLDAFRNQVIDFLAGAGITVPREHRHRLLWSEDLSRAALTLLGDGRFQAQMATVYSDQDVGFGVDSLKDCAELAPESFLANNHLGWALYHAAQYSEASHAFERALLIDPSGVSAIDGLLWLAAQTQEDRQSSLLTPRYAELRDLTPDEGEAWHWARLGSVAFESDDYEAADRAFRRAIELDPDDVSMFLIPVWHLLNQNRIGDAEAMIEIARRNLTDRFEERSLKRLEARVHDTRGFLEFRRNNYDKALEYSQLAIGLDPDDVVYQTNKVELYTRLGRFQEAKEHLEEALRRFAGRADRRKLIIAQADVYFSWGESTKDADKGWRLELYQEALDIEKEHRPETAHRTLRRMAELVTEKSDFEDRRENKARAVSMLKEALELTRHDAVALGLVARDLRKQGEYEAARDELEHAYDRLTEPDDQATVRRYLADLHGEEAMDSLWRPERALELQHLALDLEPERPSHLASLAFILHELDRDEEILELKRSVSLMPTAVQSGFYRRYAAALAESSRYQAAAEELSRALRFEASSGDPAADVEDHKTLGRYFFMSGDYSQATGHFKSYTEQVGSRPLPRSFGGCPSTSSTDLRSALRIHLGILLDYPYRDEYSRKTAQCFFETFYPEGSPPGVYAALLQEFPELVVAIFAIEKGRSLKLPESFREASSSPLLLEILQRERAALRREGTPNAMTTLDRGFMAVLKRISWIDQRYSGRAESLLARFDNELAILVEIHRYRIERDLAKIRGEKPPSPDVVFRTYRQLFGNISAGFPLNGQEESWILCNLAAIEWIDGNVTVAEDLLSRARSVAENNYGKQSLMGLVPIANLASMLLEQGDYEGARVLIRDNDPWHFFRSHAVRVRLEMDRAEPQRSAGSGDSYLEGVVVADSEMLWLSSNFPSHDITDILRPMLKSSLDSGSREGRYRDSLKKAIRSLAESASDAVLRAKPRLRDGDPRVSEPSLPPIKPRLIVHQWSYLPTIIEAMGAFDLERKDKQLRLWSRAPRIRLSSISADEEIDHVALEDDLLVVKTRRSTRVYDPALGDEVVTIDHSNGERMPKEAKQDNWGSVRKRLAIGPFGFAVRSEGQVRLSQLNKSKSFSVPLPDEDSSYPVDLLYREGVAIVVQSDQVMFVGAQSRSVVGRIQGDFRDLTYSGGDCDTLCFASRSGEQLTLVDLAVFKHTARWDYTDLGLPERSEVIYCDEEVVAVRSGEGFERVVEVVPLDEEIPVVTYSEFGVGIPDLFQRHGDLALMTTPSGEVNLWNIRSGKLIWSQLVDHHFAKIVGGRLWLGVPGNRIRILYLYDGSFLEEYPGHEAPLVDLQVEGKRAITLAADRTIKLWVSDAEQIGWVHRYESWRPEMGDNLNRIHELATLSITPDAKIIAHDSAGRFDVDRFGKLNELYWRLPDQPFRPVPLELFMRDFYEPDLVAKILSDSPLRPVRRLDEIDRRQPGVRFVGFEDDSSDPSLVSVKLEVTGFDSEMGGRGEASPPAEVRNLRLFRNGKLVRVEPADGGVVDIGQQGRVVVELGAIRLPRTGQGEAIEFSAYAFNSDGVKSETVYETYRSARLARVPGRVFIVSIGVNAYEDASMNLRFAAADARLVAGSLSEQLASLDSRYGEIISVSLTSDDADADGRLGDTENLATKARIAAVFELLAGGQPDRRGLAGIVGSERLDAVMPEDLLIVSFSGHGYSSAGGEFYLFTQDSLFDSAHDGGGSSDPAENLRRAISSEELSEWFRDIDAGEMVLIIDACYSTGSVDRGDFRPGPMGSRGLGQLAYDKGMKILVASHDAALESFVIGHGFLTYALIEEGIVARRADHQPRDGRISIGEWLRYGEDRVPALYREVADGTMPDRGVRPIGPGYGDGGFVQQPRLFDFGKGGREIVLIDSRVEGSRNALR